MLEDKIVMNRGTKTVRQARPVTWRCELCSRERETWQYPGPVPRYCIDYYPEPRDYPGKTCKQVAQAVMNAARHRDRRRAEREANPWGRRPVGRPRST